MSGLILVVNYADRSVDLFVNNDLVARSEAVHRHVNVAHYNVFLGRQLRRGLKVEIPDPGRETEHRKQAGVSQALTEEFLIVVSAFRNI